MRRVATSAFELAQRFVGVKEIPGAESNSAVLAMLRLDAQWPDNDEVPWCSAFVNYVAWLLRLPRSKALNARSWLNVGQPINLQDAEPGLDVVVLWRGSADSAQGHVGFFAGLDGERVLLLGGNQGDAVCVAGFDKARVIGVRRLA